MIKDASLIPQNTPYCYTIESISIDQPIIKTKRCPYWSIDDGDAHCEFIGLSDSDLGMGLLFDQVKECGVSIDDDFLPNTQPD